MGRLEIDRMLVGLYHGDKEGTEEGLLISDFYPLPRRHRDTECTEEGLLISDFYPLLRRHGGHRGWSTVRVSL